MFVVHGQDRAHMVLHSAGSVEVGLRTLSRRDLALIQQRAGAGDRQLVQCSHIYYSTSNRKERKERKDQYSIFAFSAFSQSKTDNRKFSIPVVLASKHRHGGLDY